MKSSQENKYKAKLFYEQKQKEHIEKYGVPFDTDSKMGEIIQEFHDQELKDLKLYAFRYNPCTWESSTTTISIHLTKEGAQRVMRNHKAKERRKWKKMFPTPEAQKEFPFGADEFWSIYQIKIEE